jgi:hypothetical protein
VKLNRKDIHRVRGEIKASQSDCCAVCGGSFNSHTYHQKKKKIVPKYKACLDHDHSSGVVRGVLCSYCNAVEGKINSAIKRYHPYCNTQEERTVLIQQVSDYMLLHTTDQTNLIHPDHLTADEKRIRTNKRARIARAKAKETA